MEVFQRAEASTFFGREIGLMYMHAHLRYAEALARVGDADGLLARARAGQPRRDHRAGRVGPAAAEHDLLLVLGRRLRRPLRGGRGLRRRSCDGEVPLEGGWRVYSSGPGLFLRLVAETLLGIRRARLRRRDRPGARPRARRPRRVCPVGGRASRSLPRSGQPARGPRRRVTVGGTRARRRPLENPYRAPGWRVACRPAGGATSAHGPRSTWRSP